MGRGFLVLMTLRMDPTVSSMLLLTLAKVTVK